MDVHLLYLMQNCRLALKVLHMFCDIFICRLLLPYLNQCLWCLLSLLFYKAFAMVIFMSLIFSTVFFLSGTVGVDFYGGGRG